MTIAEKLKDLFRARQADAAATYWDLVTRAAAGDCSEKLLASIDRARSALDKSVDDVDIDVELAREDLHLQDADSQLVAAREAHRTALRAFTDADAEARELEQRAAKVRTAAANEREHRANLEKAAEGKVAQRAKVRSRLANAGHPASVAFVTDQSKARSIENLEAALREAESELASFPNNQTRLMRRNRLVAQLDELRRGDGAPDPIAEIDDADEIVDEVTAP